MSLKVHHLSKFGLPNWCIEKSAITVKRLVLDVFFEYEKNRLIHFCLIFTRLRSLLHQV